MRLECFPSSRQTAIGGRADWHSCWGRFCYYRFQSKRSLTHTRPTSSAAPHPEQLLRFDVHAAVYANSQRFGFWDNSGQRPDRGQVFTRNGDCLRARECQRMPGNAPLRYGIPMPEDVPIRGTDAEEVALHVPVLSTVKSGGHRLLAIPTRPDPSRMRR